MSTKTQKNKITKTQKSSDKNTATNIAMASAAALSGVKATSSKATSSKATSSKATAVNTSDAKVTNGLSPKDQKKLMTDIQKDIKDFEKKVKQLLQTTQAEVLSKVKKQLGIK